MRLLVTGAAGFLGGAAVRACAAAGHEVRGLVRLPQQAAAVASLGGAAFVGSVLDPAALASAVVGCEAVVHLAQARSVPEARPGEVRVGGAAALLQAARAAGVRRFVVGSGYWVYRDNPGTIVEESPLEPLGISAINLACEQTVRRGAGSELEVVVVRPGMVYGAGSWFQEMVEELRDGSYRFVGDGGNHLSPLDLTDAGEAFRVVVESAPHGSTFLAVDDRPVRTREFAQHVAELARAPEPTGISPEEAVRRWGPESARLTSADRRASNARLRALGWAPRRRTYRDGIPEVVRRLAGPGVDGVRRG